MEKIKREAKMMNLKPIADEMEGARRATVISSAAALPGGAVKTVVPNPEVPEKATPRCYTAEYKRRILREAEACKEQGQVGDILRNRMADSFGFRWRNQRNRQ